MRGEVIRKLYYHSVEASDYPSGAHKPGTDCPCRKSLNFRGISERHMGEMAALAHPMAE
jgi:hypothetical protein